LILALCSYIPSENVEDVVAKVHASDNGHELEESRLQFAGKEDIDGVFSDRNY